MKHVKSQRIYSKNIQVGRVIGDGSRWYYFVYKPLLLKKICRFIALLISPELNSLEKHNDFYREELTRAYKEHYKDVVGKQRALTKSQKKYRDLLFYTRNLHQAAQSNYNNMLVFQGKKYLDIPGGLDKPAKPPTFPL